MVADDILREKYRREQIKRTQSNPNVLRQSQSLQQDRQKGVKPKATTRVVNNYVNSVRQSRQHVKKQFTTAEMAGMLVGKTARNVLNLVTQKTKLVSLAALGLLTVVGYLKEKFTFDTEGYSNVDRFLGKKPGTPGGFVSFGKGSLSSGKTSERMKNKIKADEGGFQSKAYWDKDGYSIGYGHHGKVDGKPIYKGQVISKEKAEQLFDQDIAKFENGVKRQLQKAGITTPISQNMFDAMVNYSYNAGSLGPKFLKKLKAGDYKGAAAELEVGEENKARMVEIRKTFLVDVSDANKLTVEAINKNVEVVQTSAGKRKRYTTGKTTGTSNPKIGNYQLWNPNTKRGYIELSDRAQKYLEETGGTGIVTSGSEGSHANGTVSHGAGNKIDVVAYGSKDEDWANCAIPFIKNKNTAFINFEDFSKERFEKIKKIIYSKIPQDLINKCEKIQKWMNSKKPQPFLTYCYIGHGLHLDIGILPNAYDPKTQATQNKTNEVKQIPQKSDQKLGQKPQKSQNRQNNGTIVQQQNTNKQPTQNIISLDSTDYERSKYKLLNQKRKNQKS